LEIDWDGSLIWNYKDAYLHHAFYRMPNGNTMTLRWVEVPKSIANKVKGGLPETEKDGVMWGDSFREINSRGEIIWEWLSYEHLDPEIDTICPLCPRDQWTQANSCVVLPNGNLLTSFSQTNTVVIINRATGNIQWRWGVDEIAHQNCPTMLENGNILLFDNGIHANGDHWPFSRILEMNPVTNKMEWEYRDKANANIGFYSGFMSGCQRLANGNTLICEAKTGRIFEATNEGEIVWEFVNPVSGFDPVYGHNRIIPRAYRYAPDYEGLEGQRIILRQFGQAAEEKVRTAEEKKRRVQSRLEQIGY